MQSSHTKSNLNQKSNSCLGCIPKKQPQWIKVAPGLEMYNRGGRSFIEPLIKPVNDLKRVKIYTDGACKNNPGVGGWGVILLHGETKKELFGGEARTTNNRMELTAVIKGLESLKEKCDVTIYSDSKYVINAFTCDWIKNWKRNGWRLGVNKELKNDDLWKALYKLTLQHEITWVWVKGHAGNSYNERADCLANKGIGN